MLITEATTQIDQWVTQLKTALDHNKSVSFENFGTFAKNEHGVISFVCDRIAELNVEYEGMEPVTLDNQKVKAEEEEETEKEVTVETEKTLAEDSESVDKSTNDEEDEAAVEDETEEPERKKRPWLVILIIVLIAALLAAAAYYFREQLTELYQQYFGKENTDQLTVEPQEETPATVVLDTTLTDSLNVEADSLNAITDAENIEETAVSEQTIVNQLPGGEKFFIDYEKGKYYVIVGSFRSEKEVREHIKSRKLEQYNPKIVLQPNSKNMRICIAIFDNEQAADSFGRSTGLNYWVLK